MSISRVIVVAASLVLAGQALAQETPPAEAPPPVEPAAPVVEPAPAPAPAPAPVVEAPAPAPAPVVEVATPPERRQADRFTVGIGAGYTFYTDLSEPNAVSIRFRLPSGLTLEPYFALLKGESAMSFGDEQEGTNYFLQLRTLVPLAERDHATLYAIGALVGQRVKNDVTDSDADPKSTFYGISAGIAVDYWFSPHFSVSLQGESTWLSYTKDELYGETERKTKTWGLSFYPRVSALAYLWF